MYSRQQVRIRYGYDVKEKKYDDDNMTFIKQHYQSTW